MSHARHKARSVALQALYQRDMTGQDTSDIERQFREDQDLKGVEMKYFLELLHQTPQQEEELDQIASKYLDRSVADLDPVERTLIRIAGYELKNRQDVPYKVVINEAVELAKSFGAEAGHKYVNGVVDKMSYDWRPTERKLPGK